MNSNEDIGRGEEGSTFDMKPGPIPSSYHASIPKYPIPGVVALGGHQKIVGTAVRRV